MLGDSFNNGASIRRALNDQTSPRTAFQSIDIIITYALKIISPSLSQSVHMCAITRSRDMCLENKMKGHMYSMCINIRRQGWHTSMYTCR